MLDQREKVRWVLEELDLPYQQILAGLEFGLNHDPEYLAMNPNGLVPLLRTMPPGWYCGNQIRLFATAAQYGVDRLWLAAPAARARKSGWIGQRHPLTRPSPGINGHGENATRQRDPAAIAARISACEALFAMLDDELAQMPWLSGEHFGLGVCRRSLRLQSVVDPRRWQPRPHLRAGISRLANVLRREVVQIPVT